MARTLTEIFYGVVLLVLIAAALMLIAACFLVGLVTILPITVLSIALLFGVLKLLGRLMLSWLDG